MYAGNRILIACLALLLTGCKVYDQGGPITSPNGLSCQNYVDHAYFDSAGDKFSLYAYREGAECSYICPDGTVRQPLLEEKFSSASTLYSASKDDLAPQFCGLAAGEPHPTETPVSATSTPPGTPTSTPTPEAVATDPALPSPTAGAPAAAVGPVLTGEVTMCNKGTNLISFRFVVPPPDLAGRTLVVQVGGQESTCSVNSVNKSLLTCTMPPGQTFPAAVLVTLDGLVVNDFAFSGLGCI